MFPTDSPCFIVTYSNLFPPTDEDVLQKQGWQTGFKRPGQVQLLFSFITTAKHCGDVSSLFLLFVLFDRILSLKENFLLKFKMDVSSDISAES